MDYHFLAGVLSPLLKGTIRLDEHRNVKVGERSTPAPLGKDPIAKDGQIRDTMLTQLGEKQLPLGVDAVGSFLTT